MDELRRFRLDGRVAVVAGGSGGIGLRAARPWPRSARRSRSSDAHRTPRRCAACRRGGGIRGPVDRGRHELQSRRRACRRRDRRALWPARHPRQLGRRRRRLGALFRRGLPRIRVGPDRRPQPPDHAPPVAGGGARDGEGRKRRSHPQPLLRPRAARHQRGVFGLRGGEGGVERAHPPARDRVGAVTGSPSTRSRPRSSAPRRLRACSPTRRSTSAWSRGSRWAASPTPTISWARCSSSARMPRRSSPARCSRSTEASRRPSERASGTRRLTRTGPALLNGCPFA